jgi:hypothetical protein
MLSVSPNSGAQPGPPPQPNAPKPAGAPGGKENRASVRRAASDVPSITGLRFKPHGVEANLVDISATGLLAECTERLKPGSNVTAVFEGTFTPNAVEGRIARCAVWSVGRDGRLRYHVGIAFSKPIPLEGDAPAPAPAAVAAPAGDAMPAPTAPAAPVAAAAPPPAPVVDVAAPAAARPAAAPAPVAPAPVPVPALAVAPARTLTPAVPGKVYRNRW